LYNPAPKFRTADNHKNSKGKSKSRASAKRIVDKVRRDVRKTPKRREHKSRPAEEEVKTRAQRDLSGKVQLEIGIPRTGQSVYRAKVSGDTMVCSGCDVISTVYTGANSQIGDVLFSTPVTPTLMGEDLVLESRQWTRAKVYGTYVFIPTAGSAVAGTIGLYFDPNPNNQLNPNNVADGSPQLQQYTACTGSKFWREFAVNSEGNMHVGWDKTMKPIFVQQNPQVTDLSELYTGVFSVVSGYTFGEDFENTLLGKIYFRYVCVFTEKTVNPPIEGTAFRAETAGVTTAASIFGSSYTETEPTNLPPQWEMYYSPPIGEGPAMQASLYPGNGILNTTNQWQSFLGDEKVSIVTAPGEMGDITTIAIEGFTGYTAPSMPAPWDKTKILTAASWTSMFTNTAVQILPKLIPAATKVFASFSDTGATPGSGPISTWDWVLDVAGDLLDLFATRGVGTFTAMSGGVKVCVITQSQHATAVPIIRAYHKRHGIPRHFITHAARIKNLYPLINAATGYVAPAATPVLSLNDMQRELTRLQKLLPEKKDPSLDHLQSELEVLKRRIDNDEKENKYAVVIVDQPEIKEAKPPVVPPTPASTKRSLSTTR